MKQLKRPLAALIVLLSASSIAIAAAANAASPSQGPVGARFGRIPDAAFTGGGPAAHFKEIPDFVEALDNQGNVVGYVKKTDLFRTVVDPRFSSKPTSTPETVFAADGKTVVGHMVPGRGFVPLGKAPESAPEIPVEVVQK